MLRVALFLGFVAGIALAASCGSGKACDASNCPGCCTADGACEFGGLPQACGANGAACVSCGPAEACTLNTCIPTSSGGGGGGGGEGGGGGVDGGPDGGGGGGGVQDAGADGGGNTQNDAGTNPGTDAGTATGLTIRQLRTQSPVGQRVVLADVIVRDVSYTQQGSLGDWRAEFWVVDPAQPKDGLWVEKFYTDLPGTYVPQVGDRLSIDGWYSPVGATTDRSGYRPALRSEYAFGGSGKLVVTLKGTATPPTPPTVFSGSFGNASGGSGKPNLEFAGARVHIAGPLTLTDPAPTAFARYAYGQLQGFNGFEVSGGILVNSYKTYGPTRCDWAAVVSDGGFVTFPNGISGVWDTYTHAPCVDAGTPSCIRAPGFVPGTANDYTLVIYPQDCANDLVGAAQ